MRRNIGIYIALLSAYPERDTDYGAALQLLVVPLKGKENCSRTVSEVCFDHYQNERVSRAERQIQA